MSKRQLHSTCIAVVGILVAALAVAGCTASPAKPSAGKTPSATAAAITAVQPPYTVPTKAAGELARIVYVHGSAVSDATATVAFDQRGFEIESGCASRSGTASIRFELVEQKSPSDVLVSGSMACDGASYIDTALTPGQVPGAVQLELTGDFTGVTKAYAVLTPDTQ